MNQDRNRLGSIHSELDAAFARVQAARSMRELGHEDAQHMARECVASAEASINRRLLETPLSEGDSRLIQAKLKALVEAAGRIPGPNVDTGYNAQQTKPSRMAR